MKKLLYSLIIIIAAICACQDENSELGKSLVDSSFYNIYVDTCTVDISTILMDSIETRGDSICQLGHYKDPSWGKPLPPTMPNTPQTVSLPTRTTVTASTHSYCG